MSAATKLTRPANTPTFLTGATLLFWGWQTGLLLAAVPLALLLEIPRLAGLRLQIQPRDFGRFMDLCIVLLLGQGAYLFLTPQEDAPLLLLGQWLPVTLVPLTLAEALHAERITTIPAMFSTLRRRKTLQHKQPLRFSFAPVYVLAVLFAAGCGNTRSPLFYPVLALLVGWWLYGVRPRRFPVWLWSLLALATLTTGFVGQWSIHQAQEAVRGWVQRDPFKTTTAVGQVGEVKLSGRIILRLRPSQPLSNPLLLREAAYDFFTGTHWQATNAEFTQLSPQPDSNESSWELLDFAEEGNKPSDTTAKPDWNAFEVFQYFRWRGGLLHLPAGARRITSLPGAGVGQNRFRAVRVRRAPGLCAYTVHTHQDAMLEAPPTAVDQVVLPKQSELLQVIVAQLGLDGLSVQEKMKRIRLYFLKNFKYTLKLERSRPELSPLREFLLHTRAGHCEYFAMAAVFLLRQAGIPARYALGHMVHEYDADQQLYLVRERDAHSWALAYVDGAWLPLDVTPPIWLEADAQGSSWLEAVSDLQQRLAFAFARWRWLGQDAETRRILFWILGPLLLFLLVRLGRSLRLRRGMRAAGSRSFARVEARLARRKGPRAPAETLGDYLRRAGALELLPALRIHYASRFDPQGASQEQLQVMERQIRDWLREN